MILFRDLPRVRHDASQALVREESLENILSGVDKKRAEDRADALRDIVSALDDLLGRVFKPEDDIVDFLEKMLARHITIPRKVAEINALLLYLEAWEKNKEIEKRLAPERIRLAQKPWDAPTKEHMPAWERKRQDHVPPWERQPPENQPSPNPERSRTRER